MDYKIAEVYDGRLPEYQIVLGDKIIETFDTYEDAENFIHSKQDKTTPCGEEDPCQ